MTCPISTKIGWRPSAKGSHRIGCNGKKIMLETLNKTGLVQEYLKGQFFDNKELSIDFYLNNKYLGEKENYTICEYTQGKKVIVDLNTNKAYTRNGFLFSVILQDKEYLDAIGKYEIHDVLTTLSEKFAAKYTKEEETETGEDSIDWDAIAEEDE